MNQGSTHSKQITLFLAGDVMTGRGVDQNLPHPSDPHLYEAYMKSAVAYVELAKLKEDLSLALRWDEQGTQR